MHDPRLRQRCQREAMAIFGGQGSTLPAPRRWPMAALAKMLGIEALFKWVCRRALSRIRNAIDALPA